MTDDLLKGAMLLLSGSALSGIVWTVHKVVQHEAWLEHIKASMERIEAKLDRLIEKHFVEP